MTGSSPNPAPRPPRTVKRQRSHKSGSAVWAVGSLFVVYILIGLLLSVPAPPFWIWIPAAIGTVLLAMGINRPMASGNPKGRTGFLAYSLVYLGALLLVVALAIAANYIGSDQGFDDVRFFVAIFGLAMLTLLAVVLTVTAAIASAQAGATLMRTTGYARSLTVVLSACFFGMCLGGFIGFVTMLL